MTASYTPLLQRELDAYATTQARHAIAVELLTFRDAARFWRTTVRLDGTVGFFGIASGTAYEGRIIYQTASKAFPREHPAPGRLGWCLVNSYGPTCGHHAEPGSDFCKAHAYYADGAPAIRWGNLPG